MTRWIIGSLLLLASACGTQSPTDLPKCPGCKWDYKCIQRCVDGGAPDPAQPVCVATVHGHLLLEDGTEVTDCSGF